MVGQNSLMVGTQDRMKSYQHGPDVMPLGGSTTVAPFGVRVPKTKIRQSRRHATINMYIYSSHLLTLD